MKVNSNYDVKSVLGSERKYIMSEHWSSIIIVHGFNYGEDTCVVSNLFTLHWTTPESLSSLHILHTDSYWATCPLCLRTFNNITSKLSTRLNVEAENFSEASPTGMLLLSITRPEQHNER